MKKFLLIFLALPIVLYSLYLSRHVIMPPPEPKMTLPLTPKNTVFAFDLHGVLLLRDSRKIGGLVKEKFFKVKPWNLLFNPTLWYDYYTLPDASSAKIVIESLGKKHPGVQHLKDFCNELMLCYDINRNMFQLMSNLKKQGYELYMLSDVWDEPLELLKIKYPELNQLFNGYFSPNMVDYKFVKPSKELYEAFKEYIAKMPQNKDKQIVFIDNRSKNTRGAAHSGIVGVYFYSVDHLQDFLDLILEKANLEKVDLEKNKH